MLLKPSVAALLAVSVFPLIGVLFLGWDVFLLLALYWVENVVVGLYTALKLTLVSSAGPASRLTAAAFFCVHYGLFTAVHGVFVFGMFGGGWFGSSPDAPAFQRVMESQLLWGGLALIISHGVSFAYNYIRRGEYRQAKLNDVMMEPYGRVVLLHVTIIFGGFLVALLGSPVIGLLLLTVSKTVLDIGAHLRQHEKYESQEEQSS